MGKRQKKGKRRKAGAGRRRERQREAPRATPRAAPADPAPDAAPPPSLRRQWPMLALLAATLLAGYVYTMPSGVALEDNGELLAVAHHTGIAHPPGYPTLTMLMAIFARLPLGNDAVRVHLVSALFATGACLALYGLLLLWTRQRAVAAAGALLAGWTPVLWSQAIIAEVYAGHAFFFCLALYLCARQRRWPTARGLPLCALVFGLGLTHHWPLMLLGAPALACVLWPQRRELLRRLPLLAGFLAVSLLPYAYLYIRSQLHPQVTAFGELSTLGDLWAHVSRRQYRAVDVESTANLTDTLRYARLLLWRLGGAFGWWLAPLWPLGLWAARRLLPTGEWLALLWAALVGPLLLLAGVRQDFDNLRAQFYLDAQVVPFALAAVLAALALGWLLARLPRARWRAPAAGAALALVLGSALFANGAANDRHRGTLAQDYAEALLDSLPRGALLVVNSDVDTGAVAFCQLVRRRRPDVRVYSRTGFLMPLRLADSRRPGWKRRARVRLEALIASEGAIFDSDIARSPIAPSRYSPRTYVSYGTKLKVTDYGLFHQIGDRQRKVARAPLVARARRILDRHLAGDYVDRWPNHRQMVLGRLCQTLIAADRLDHPALERVPRCRHHLARYLASKRAAYGAAAELLESLLADGRHPPKRLQLSIHNDYFLIELAAIETVPRPARPARWQRLVDRSMRAVRLLPVCDNVLATNILELARLTRVEVDLAYFRRALGRCPAVAAKLSQLGR